MGISGDIRPPKKEHRETDSDVKKADSKIKTEEEPKQEKPEEKPKSELRPLEKIEEKISHKIPDDFFSDTKKFGLVKPKKEKKESPKITDQGNLTDNSTDNTSEPKKHNKKALLLLWLLFLVLIGILIYENFSAIKGAFIKDDAGSKSNSIVNTPAATYQGEQLAPSSSAATDNSASTAPASAPAPAATPAVDKSAIKLELLNGNGITGSAASVKKILTDAGFSVSLVGNAKTFTYATTIVYFHTGKSDAADLVKTTLSTRSVSTALSDTITGNYDIVVVVGKK